MSRLDPSCPHHLSPQSAPPNQKWRLPSMLRFDCLCLMLCLTLSLVGCSDDSATVRAIQAKQQARLQAESRQDHLDEVFQLLGRFAELNKDSASRRIIFHLNQWLYEHPIDSDTAVPTKLLKSYGELLDKEAAADRIEKTSFRAEDITHLRDSYLFRQIANRVDSEINDDLLLKDWLAEKSKELSETEADQLRTAARLFDWTVRNIAIEPLSIPASSTSKLKLQFGMQLNGPGYRQKNFDTLWRGTGDGFQRGGVFLQLCRQAGVPAAMLGVQLTKTGEVTPWCCGVRIGKEVYLFEALLGTFLPGPDQVGIATLQQARRDASVMRRLGIPGVDLYEKYPFSKDDVQLCVAMLNVLPESVSPRMKKLESGLTGTRRLTIYADVEKEAKAWDEAAGISDVQLWELPLLSEKYAAAMDRECERDQRFMMFHRTPWMFLESGDTSAEELSQGRWQHLVGKFSDDEDENVKGARTLYMSQRAPEFEIEDLMINVELQKKYFRRALGTDVRQYRQELQAVQAIMRMGKRTATYWLSHVQFDDNRIETANNWFEKRVLDQNQASYWQPAARYNVARTAEMIGDYDKAINLYKTPGDPQEHGNRIRARLVKKHIEE